MSAAGLEAIILCGGRGERLRAALSDRPKPLAPLFGKPFLDHLLDWLKKFGVERVVLSAGYMGEMIRDAYHHRPEIRVVIEEKPLGTGGALAFALPQTKGEYVLALNGDSICPVNLTDFFAAALLQKPTAALVLTQVEDARDYGTVEVDAKGRVQGFLEKRPEQKPGLVNAGVYLLERAWLSTLPPDKAVSLEKDLFPKLSPAEFFGWTTSIPHLDIGTPERLRAAEEWLSRHGAVLREAFD